MQELSRHELEVLTEAAHSVYQGSKNGYADKHDDVKKKHVFDADEPDTEYIIPDYMKLFNSDDVSEKKENDTYYIPNKITGFKYAVYQNIKDKNDIVLAFAGTDFPDLRDLCNDLEMLIVIPEQTREAFNAYAAVKKIHRGAKITITGHSLGGSLAQIVGAVTGEKTVTFNPYGVKRLLWSLKDIYVNPNANYDNIINYRMENDLLYKIFKDKNDNILGTVYIVEGNPTNPIHAHKMLYYIIDGKKYSPKVWEEKQKAEKLKRVYKNAKKRLQEIEKNFETSPNKKEQIERFKIRIENSLGYLNSIPISDIPEIKNSPLIKSIDKINETLSSLSYNMLVQFNLNFRQFIPTSATNIINTDNTDNSSCINIVKKLEDSYKNFNNRDYEKEMIKEAERVMEEARKQKHEALKQEIKQEIIRDIMRAYRKAAYKSQGMSDERFNAIMTYISEQLKEALKHRSYYKKYYLPGEI